MELLILLVQNAGTLVGRTELVAAIGGAPPSTVAAMLWLPDDAVILQDAARPGSGQVSDFGAVAFAR